MYHIEKQTEFSQAPGYSDEFALLPSSKDPIMNSASTDTPTLMMDMLNSNQSLQNQENNSSSSSLDYSSGFSMPSLSLSTFNDLNLQHQDLTNFSFFLQKNTFESLSILPAHSKHQFANVESLSGNHEIMPDADHIEFGYLPWSTNNEVTTQKKSYLSQQIEESPHECPLPMSGVSCRKMSIVTDSDISIWKKMLEDRPFKKAKANEPKNETEVSGDYPVITEADMEAAKVDPNAIPRRQNLKHEGDKYTPKWVRYTGQLKEGYCDTCDQGKWLQLKNSAYWYHKQFYHGISSTSGCHFRDPINQRQKSSDILEGLCHQCKEYVPVSNIKRKNSVLWYRHAYKCHVYNRPKTKIGPIKRGSISVNN